MKGEVVNDEPRTWLERGDLVLKDVDAHRIWPVVEDVAEVVDVGSMGWLLRAEVVLSEIDSRSKLFLALQGASLTRSGR
jgi:hypothetical protein